MLGTGPGHPKSSGPLGQACDPPLDPDSRAGQCPTLAGAPQSQSDGEIRRRRPPSRIGSKEASATAAFEAAAFAAASKSLPLQAALQGHGGAWALCPLRPPNSSGTPASHRCAPPSGSHGCGSSPPGEHAWLACPPIDACGGSAVIPNPRPTYSAALSGDGGGGGGFCERGAVPATLAIAAEALQDPTRPAVAAAVGWAAGDSDEEPESDSDMDFRCDGPSPADMLLPGGGAGPAPGTGGQSDPRPVLTIAQWDSDETMGWAGLEDFPAWELASEAAKIIGSSDLDWDDADGRGPGGLDLDSDSGGLGAVTDTSRRPR